MATKRNREESGALEMAKSLIVLSQEENAVVFECRTCNRQFPSFQALGGHRASHKRPRTAGEEAVDGKREYKQKNHECGICGQEYSTGQALGGHMRRHRAAMNGGGFSEVPVMNKLPVVKRTCSKRVMLLDLNLTPLENDLKLLFGKMTPTLDFLI